MTNTRYQSLILFFLPFVILLVFRLVFNFNGLYGQDAHRYFQFVGELEAYFATDRDLGEFHWPVWFPLSGLLLKWLTGVGGALALQFLSTISLSISALVLFGVLRNHAKQEAFLFVLVFLIFCPQMLISSAFCMSDLYSAMWAVLCWYSWFRFQNEGKWQWALWMSLFGALATIARYPALMLVILPLILAFVQLIRQRKYKVLLMPLIFALACLPELLLHPTVDSVSGSYQLNHWSMANWFKSYFATNDGIQQYRFTNLIYITYPFWHPAYLIVGIAFVIIGWIRYGMVRTHWVLPFSIAVYLLFIGGIEFQNRRFFMLVFPLILILIYKSGFELALKRVVGRQRLLIAVTLVMLQLAIVVHYAKPYLEMNRFERKLAEEMKPYQGRKLYAFYWDIALQSYGCNFEYFNLWQKPIVQPERGNLVLFNAEGLQEQWAGSLLMDNWKALSKENDLKRIHQWQNGWKLYEVE